MDTTKKQTNPKEETNDDVPMFGAHYKAMDRNKKRSYKRWLINNKYWDGKEIKEIPQS